MVESDLISHTCASTIAHRFRHRSSLSPPLIAFATAHRRLLVARHEGQAMPMPRISN
jgi:hypothetical protein